MLNRRLLLPLTVAAALAGSVLPASALASDATDDIGDAPSYAAVGNYLTYDTDGATEETGEPAHIDGTAKSVWIKWTAVNAGNMRIDGCNSKPMGVHLKVYKQWKPGVDSVTNLAAVPAGEQLEHGCDGAYQVIAAKASQTYYVVIVRSKKYLTADPGAGFFLSQKTQAPAVSFVDAKKAYGKAATISFESKPAAKKYVCTLDGADKSCDGGSVTAVFGKSGEHELVVHGIDDHGNVGAPVSWKFTSDATPPDTFIDSAPPVSGAPIALKFHSSPDTGVTYTCQFDNVVKNPCTSGWQTPAAQPGPHKITVTAKDAFGNVDQTPAVQSFTVAGQGIAPVQPQEPVQPQQPSDQPQQPQQGEQPSLPQSPQQSPLVQQPPVVAPAAACATKVTRGKRTRRGLQVRLQNTGARQCLVTLKLRAGRRVVARKAVGVAPGQVLKVTLKPRVKVAGAKLRLASSAR
jgi:hypothetical protein